MSRIAKAGQVKPQRIWPEDVARFKSHVNVNGPLPERCPELGPCHLWMLAPKNHGRGAFKFAGSEGFPAATVAFLIANGRWAVPLTLHRCGRGLCCNPDHLYEGDDKQNAADRTADGRTIMPDNTGDRNGMRKLDSTTVAEIKRRLRAGAKGRDLAKEFSVSGVAISQIKTGARWAHVTI